MIRRMMFAGVRWQQFLLRFCRFAFCSPDVAVVSKRRPRAMHQVQGRQLLQGTGGTGSTSSSGTTTDTGTGAGPAASISISPSSTTVTLSGTQQFTASVTGASSTTVSWAVNGVAGGNAATGTITSNGLYTASTPGTYTVTATSASDASLIASATVNVPNPPPPPPPPPISGVYTYKYDNGRTGSECEREQADSCGGHQRGQFRQARFLDRGR